MVLEMSSVINCALLVVLPKCEDGPLGVSRIRSLEMGFTMFLGSTTKLQYRVPL